MSKSNGKDLFALLIDDIEELEAASLARRTRSARMHSLSETMGQVAKTMALIAKAMARESVRVGEHERLYSRLAKTLVAFNDSSDDRYRRVRH